MKYNININQYAAIKLGLEDKLDIVDLSIFSMLYQFGNMPACIKMHEDGQHWYRFKHGLIQKELPILKLTTRQAIHKRMQKLVSCGLLECHADNQKNRDSFYKFTELAGKLWFTDVNENEHSVKDGLHTSVKSGLHTSVKDGLHDNNTSSYNNTNLYNNKEKQSFQEVIKEVLPKPSKKQTSKPLYPASFTDTLIKACDSFFDYRKDIKKPYKNQASMMAKIAQFKAQAEKHGEGFVIFSINETISNGWTGTFADDKMIKNYLASIQTTNNNGNQPNNLHPETAKTIDYLKHCIDTFDLNTL
jgi:hypothetical protein